MKKRCALFLIAVLLLIPVLSFTSCEKEDETFTFVGTIANVQRLGNYHILYVSPIGEIEKLPWIMFKIGYSTEMDSEFSVDLSKMPELAIGNTVELVYKEYTKQSTYGSSTYVTYDTVSIKSIDLTSVTDEKLLESPLKLSENYNFDTRLQTYWIKGRGKVLHIAKLDGERKGYLIYVVDFVGTFSPYMCFWVDDNAEIKDEMLARLESGETGYTIQISACAGPTFTPFEYLDIYACISVWVE